MEGVTPRTRRAEVACEVCRKRKRKCDGARPSCSSCLALGGECEYSGYVETRKRKPRDVEHIASLEAEIASLKLYIESLEQPNSTTGLGETSFGHYIEDGNKHCKSEVRNESADFNDISTGRDPTSKAGLSTAAVDEVAALVWKMSIGSAGQPEFTGPSGNFCFPSSSQKAHEAINPARVQQSPTASHRTSNPVNIADLPLREHLLFNFLNQINCYHYFLEPSTVLSAAEYPTGSATLDFLYCAIFAAGACLTSDPYARQAGDSFAAQADLVALSCCREEPSTLGIQALSILAWRELTQERDTIGWIYNSIAGGLTLSMGLHVIGLQDLSDCDTTTIQHSKDSRIRTFWSFFLLDRMATSLLGRNCIIPWRRVNVPSLPSILPSNSSTSELAFAYQCQLWFLHDQYMDQIYAFDFHTLDTVHRNKLLLEARTALFNYKEILPPALRLSSLRSNLTGNIDPTALFLNMSYEMSILLIHRPFLQESPSSESFRVAILTMTLAAANMARDIREFYKICSCNEINSPKTRFAITPPHFIVHHVLTASIMHLLNGTSDSAQHRSRFRRNLQTCMQFLGDLQTTWPSALKAIQQIKDLASRWNVVAILPMRFSNADDIPVKGHDTAVDASVLLYNDTEHGLAAQADFSVSAQSQFNSATGHQPASLFHDSLMHFSGTPGYLEHKPMQFVQSGITAEDDFMALLHDTSMTWPPSYDVDTFALHDMLDFALQNDS